MDYLLHIDEKEEGCIFCTKPQQKKDRDDLILLRGEKNFIILNKYPYNNGHLMVVPYDHTSDCAALSDAVALEMWQLINRCKEVLQKAAHPDGFNIGMNIGRTAGAGIDQHVHMHIVPRWNGDTNFMPVLGDTRVIPQGIFESYDMLKPYFDEAGSIATGD